MWRASDFIIKKWRDVTQFRSIQHGSIKFNHSTKEQAHGTALFHQGILPADAERLAASVQSLQKSQPLGIVQAPNWYEAKSPIFRHPPPAVPRPKSQEVLRRNGV